MWRVVVPSQEYTALLFSHHTNICGGHFNFKKTYKQLSNSFYWPRMYQCVLNYCRACPTCAAKKKNSPIAKPDLSSVPFIRRSPDSRPNDYSVLQYLYKPKRGRRARAVPNSDATTKTSLSSRLFFPSPLSPAPYHSKVSVERDHNYVWQEPMQIAALFEGKIGAQRDNVGTRAPPHAVLASKPNVVLLIEPRRDDADFDVEGGVKPEESAWPVEGPHGLLPQGKVGPSGPPPGAGVLVRGPDPDTSGLEGGGPREEEGEGETPPKMRRRMQEKEDRAQDLQLQLEKAGKECDNFATRARELDQALTKAARDYKNSQEEVETLKTKLAETIAEQQRPDQEHTRLQREWKERP
ncbi:MAG: hypothetical protein GY822_00295, partial [Deltaproteobacteria bacterium]|nr:hypothetical protein [Deltaproteobacteria bacterium]